MSDLKPIGSEKLTGQDKLKRIMEIATYKENFPKSLKENANSEFSVSLADGTDYEIVKEKQGYIIKKVVAESVSEYIEPLRNRKYYSSYSQALKRLNLLAKELNRLNENEEGVTLFGEQKKFVLKTPKPSPDMSEPTPPPAEPPAVPSPELPPSPDSSMDMGPEETSPEVDTSTEMDAEISSPEGKMDIETSSENTGGMDEKITFKTIQKLTGKLTQKIRTLDNEEGMTSENIKYVINMVLSSLDLGSLSEEDKEDILSKFEEVESEDEMGMEGPSGEEDITSDEEVEKFQADMDVPVDQEMAEGNHGMILNNVFKESRVDKVLSKYFELTKKEILEERQKKENRKKTRQVQLEQKMKAVLKFTESIEQELASRKFLEENFKFSLVGKTNKKNLIFESSEKQVKITPEGIVI